MIIDCKNTTEKQKIQLKKKLRENKIIHKPNGFGSCMGDTTNKNYIYERGSYWVWREYIHGEINYTLEEYLSGCSAKNIVA